MGRAERNLASRRQLQIDKRTITVLVFAIPVGILSADAVIITAQKPSADAGTMRDGDLV